MNQDTVISLDGVSKKFKLYANRERTIKDHLVYGRKYNSVSEVLVLDDISFSVKKGEMVGIIGRNGCGKSTILKLITKIIYPTSGTIESTGKISSIIELGAGFHPDMTGRENVYVNASIHGLSKKEIDDKFESIVEFSGLGMFMDQPIRTYSSGMYARLAFSVAINVDAEILLIDEILSVGDAEFQAKCLAKITDLKSKGTTIIFVTHSMEQVIHFCDAAIWIDGGKIMTSGLPEEVCNKYLNFESNV